MGSSRRRRRSRLRLSINSFLSFFSLKADRFMLWSILLLSCQSPQELSSLYHDQSTLHQLLPYTNPKGVLELESWLRAEVLRNSLESKCPQVLSSAQESLELKQHELKTEELWLGNCTQTKKEKEGDNSSLQSAFLHPLGGSNTFIEQLPSSSLKTPLPLKLPSQDLQIDGSLLFRTKKKGASSQQRIDADSFSLYHFDAANEQTTFLYLDGTIILNRYEDLLSIELMGTFCGLYGDRCTTNPRQLELYSTLYPLSTYPQNYHHTLSGTLFSPTPHGFEGSWEINAQLCEIEPSSGAFGAQRVKRHDLMFDGANKCDHCAQWMLQGEERAEFCLE